MKTKEEIEQGLHGFIGTEQYWPTVRSDVVMTDGVRWLSEAADCPWLIEAICAYQPQARKNRGTAQGQFWKFVKDGKDGGTLQCGSGSRRAKPVVEKQFVNVNFPVDNIQLYCMDNHDGRWVILLPGEY